MSASSSLLNLISVLRIASFTVGGIEIPDLQIGLADRGSWPGDYISTGILGLGLRPLTAKKNDDGAVVTYDPLVSAMQGHDVPAIFSLALSRDDDESFLAFGGIPDVEVGEFASLPIIEVSCSAAYFGGLT